VKVIMGVAVVVVSILVVVLLVRHHKSVAVWRRWQAGQAHFALQWAAHWWRR
jgi:hypothetical protein